MDVSVDRVEILDDEVLAWIGRFRFVTAGLVGERFGVSVQKARRRLRRLEREGFVARERSHQAEDFAVFLTGAGAARVGSNRLEGIVDAYVQSTSYDGVRFLLSDPALAARLSRIVEREVRQARSGIFGDNLQLDITVSPWPGAPDAQRQKVADAIARAGTPGW